MAEESESVAVAYVDSFCITPLPYGKIFGATMLVAGTCIGAGMLGLPVSTAASGFYPATFAFLFCWIFMAASAFFMLEVSLWYSEETNLITMARSTLGKGGEFAVWLSYVFFLYALMAAYTSGAAAFIDKSLIKIGLPKFLSVWLVIFFFGGIVYLGTRYVDWVNRLLMTSLIATYICLLGHGLPKVELGMLSGGQSKYLGFAAPLLVTSFGFHLLIPTLKNYLNKDLKALRITIFLGSLLPLVVYLLWEMLVLGVVPLGGANGLIMMLHAEHEVGQQAVIGLTQLLSQLLENNHISWLAGVFGLSTLLTSFIGVGVGLFDFFADGLRIRKTHRGKMGLACLTFLPPLLIAIFCPGYLKALHYAGIFAAILLVIFPTLMVWCGRYKLKLKGYQVRGGKGWVLLTLIFGFGVIMLEVANRFNLLPVP